MSRRMKLVAVGVLVGFAAGWAVKGRSDRQSPPRLPAGSVVTVERPTGEVVSGVGGGHPQSKMERTSLRVVKVQGEPAAAGGSVWRVTLGGVTYVAVAD